MTSVGKLLVQRKEQDGNGETLRGDRNVTFQELMGGTQELLALCSALEHNRLWHVSSAFLALCRVLWQQAGPFQRLVSCNGACLQLLSLPQGTREAQERLSFCHGVHSAFQGFIAQHFHC